MAVTVLRTSFQPGDLGRAPPLLVPARTDRPPALCPSPRPTRSICPQSSRRARISSSGSPKRRRWPSATPPALGIDTGWSPRRVDMTRARRTERKSARRSQQPTTGPPSRPRHEILGAAAHPVSGRYEGRSVLGRLWMEFRQHLRDGDPAARSALERNKSESAPSRTPQEF